MTALTCEIRGFYGSTVAAPAGEVDLKTHQALYDCVAPHLVQHATVVINCSGILFMDSLGLRALIRLNTTAEQVGARLVLTSIPRHMALLLELTGLAPLFVTDDQPPEAEAPAAP